MFGKVFCILLAALWVMLPAGCTHRSAGATLDEGLVRIDASDPASAVLITVRNTSRSVHELRIVLPGGTVLVDAQVPTRPQEVSAVWRGFGAGVAGMPLMFAVDGYTRDFTIQRDTREVTIDVGLPVGEAGAVRQSPQRAQRQ